MTAFGSLWRALTGADAAERPPPASTVPRDLSSLRPAPAFEPLNIDEVEPSETRTAERFVPNKNATVLTTADGRRFPARIINISRTGVAVETGTGAFDPAAVTLVGTRPVAPGRRIALGHVFTFRKPLDPKLCGPDIVL